MLFPLQGIRILNLEHKCTSKIPLKQIPILFAVGKACISTYFLQPASLPDCSTKIPLKQIPIKRNEYKNITWNFSDKN